jgi:hypothetical protein
VTDNSDQLAQLGEQVVAAITAAYNPHNDSTLALALHPGQALADGIVQGGVTNELRLSEWIAGQYDSPMVLKLADGTPVTTTTLGGITAKSAYVTMARWGQPGVAPDAASFPRLAQLISDVRQDIGEHPETLPFGCEPTDFALPDSPAWQIFDTKISTHTSEETVTPGPAPAVEANPDLWKIRALSEVTIAELPQRRRIRQEMQEFSAVLPDLSNEMAVKTLRRSRYEVQPTVAADTGESINLDAPASAFVLADSAVDRASVFRAAVSEAAPARSFRSSRFSKIAVADAVNEQVSLQVEPTSPAPEPAAPAMVQLDATLAQELVHVSVGDLVDQPAVSTATTADTSLHVHFEYVVLSITRLMAGRPWWHPEFVAEPAWYVAGMKRGALVPESPDPAYGHCLPQSLLVVRNVSLTGVWSDEAKATMNQSVHYFGPFLMSPPDQTQTTSTEAQHAELTTILGLGVQVIGELCSKLPPLPPMDDPALI